MSSWAVPGPCAFPPPNWRGPASPPGPTCGSSPNRARRRAGASPRASTITPLLNGAPLGWRSIRKNHPHTRRAAHTDRSRSISGPSRSHNIRPAVRVQAVEAVLGKDDEVERRHGGFGAAHHAAIFSAVAWRSPGWVMVGTWNCTSPSTSAPGDGLSPPRPVMTYVPQQSSSLSAPSGEGGRYAADRRRGDAGALGCHDRPGVRRNRGPGGVVGGLAADLRSARLDPP